MTPEQLAKFDEYLHECGYLIVAFDPQGPHGYLIDENGDRLGVRAVEADRAWCAATAEDFNDYVRSDQ